MVVASFYSAGEEMARKKLLLLLKPLDVYPSVTHSNGLSRIINPLILRHLDDRRKVHNDAVKFCQDVLQKKSVDWKLMLCADLSESIRNYDLIITVGGDGTLLQASHFVDDSIPVLGLNSDPTQAQEMDELRNVFDASRSTGYLCAATVKNFEIVLDGILKGETLPVELSRISASINSQTLMYALNDILIAHPCPAAVSRISFKIKSDGKEHSPLVNCRSSGLRVSTAAGSTAAMLSSGGFKMARFSKDLQYMVREPILPEPAISRYMHGLIKPEEQMEATWFCEEGAIYIDGSHVCYSIRQGDSIKVSSRAPVLKVFLPLVKISQCQRM